MSSSAGSSTCHAACEKDGSRLPFSSRRFTSFGRRQIDLPAFLAKLLAHFGHAGFRFGEGRSGPSTVLRTVPLPCKGRGGLFGFEEGVGARILFRGEVPDLLRDLHAAEFGAAHRTEVGRLRALRREGLVVILLGGVGVEAEVELVAPAEFEPCA